MPMTIALSRVPVMLAAGALLSQMAGVAHASGRLGPVPIPPQMFGGFTACRTFLDNTYRNDLAKAEPKPVAIEGGSTRQTLVETQGPIAQDGEHASYDVTEGWQVRHPEPEKGYVEVSYSFRRTIMACNGGALTGTSEEGYNLPSREYLPASGNPH